MGGAVGASAVLGYDIKRVSEDMPDGSIEDQMRWLVEQLQLESARVDELDKTIRDYPESWRADIEAVRHQLEAGQREAIHRSAERRIHIRLLGLAYVVLGLVLSLIGNLV